VLDVPVATVWLVLASPGAAPGPRSSPDVLHARRTARCSSLPPLQRLLPPTKHPPVPCFSFSSSLSLLNPGRPPVPAAHLHTAACLRRLPPLHCACDPRYADENDLSTTPIVAAFGLDPHSDRRIHICDISLRRPAWCLALRLLRLRLCRCLLLRSSRLCAPSPWVWSSKR
jgi:hypothetical protein